jgi:hypothetical protein
MMADPPITGVHHDLADHLQAFTYGTIGTMVSVGALDARRAPSAHDALIIVAGMAVATWLAHAFSAVVALNVRERRGITRGEMAGELWTSWQVVVAALPSCFMLVLAGRGLMTVPVALGIDTVLGIVALIAVGVVAARASSFTAVGVALYTVAATSIGVAIVVLEILIHH